MSIAKKGQHAFWGITAFLVVCIIPTYLFSEYGTLGLLTAIFGYLVRHRDEFDKDLIFKFMVTVLVAFLIVQNITFDFTIYHFVVMAIGTALIRLLLLDFKSASYPELTKRFLFVKPVFQFCGRKTLEVYVVHLLLFKVIAVSLGFDGFGWFDLKWT